MEKVDESALPASGEKQVTSYGVNESYMAWFKEEMERKFNN